MRIVSAWSKKGTCRRKCCRAQSILIFLTSHRHSQDEYDSSENDLLIPPAAYPRPGHFFRYPRVLPSLLLKDPYSTCLVPHPGHPFLRPCRIPSLNRPGRSFSSTSLSRRTCLPRQFSNSSPPAPIVPKYSLITLEKWHCDSPHDQHPNRIRRHTHHVSPVILVVLPYFYLAQHVAWMFTFLSLFDVFMQQTAVCCIYVNSTQFYSWHDF